MLIFGKMSQAQAIKSICQFKTTMSLNRRLIKNILTSLKRKIFNCKILNRSISRRKIGCISNSIKYKNLHWTLFETWQKTPDQTQLTLAYLCDSRIVFWPIPLYFVRHSRNSEKTLDRQHSSKFSFGFYEREWDYIWSAAYWVMAYAIVTDAVQPLPIC